MGHPLAYQVHPLLDSTNERKPGDTLHLWWNLKALAQGPSEKCPLEQIVTRDAAQALAQLMMQQGDAKQHQVDAAPIGGATRSIGDEWAKSIDWQADAIAGAAQVMDRMVSIYS